MKNVNPFVRYASVMKAASLEKRERRAADNRIFYFFSGKGELLINREKYAVAKNALFFIPANTPYTFLAEDLFFISINFDFTQENAEKITPFNVFTTTERCEKMYTPEEFSLPLAIKDGYAFERELNKITAIFFSEERYYREFASARLRLVLLKMITEEKFNIGNPLVADLISYIKNNYGEQIKNQDIAAYFNYHPNHLNRLIKKQTGLSFKEFVIRHRINVSKNLLISTSDSITEIAENCGFSSPSYFAKMFLKYEGITPREYRATMKNNI